MTSLNLDPDEIETKIAALSLGIERLKYSLSIADYESHDFCYQSTLANSLTMVHSYFGLVECITTCEEHGHFDAGYKMLKKVFDDILDNVKEGRSREVKRHCND